MRRNLELGEGGCPGRKLAEGLLRHAEEKWDLPGDPRSNCHGPQKDTAGF